MTRLSITAIAADVSSGKRSAEAVIAEVMGGPDEITIADIIDQDVSGDPAPQATLSPDAMSAPEPLPAPEAGEQVPAEAEAAAAPAAEAAPEPAPL